MYRFKVEIVLKNRLRKVIKLLCLISILISCIALILILINPSLDKGYTALWACVCVNSSSICLLNLKK